MSNFFKKTKRASEEIEYDAIHGNNNLPDWKESELAKVHARMESEFNRLAALEKENAQLKTLLRELVMREKLCFPNTAEDAEWLDDGRSIGLIYKIEELLGIGGGA
jgi:hypothetical protein